MKKDIICLGNALMDIVVNVTNKDIQRLNLNKGSSHPHIFLKNVEKALRKKEKKYVLGGSPANTIANASYLGAKCGFIGSVGNDNIGKTYHQELKKKNIENYLSDKNGKSGVCYILITPDGERTNVADIGVAKEYEIPITKIEEYKIFHTAAYELISNKDATLSVMKYAKNNNVKTSFDISDPNLIGRNKKDIEEALNYVDILFGNEMEAKVLTGLNPEKAIDKLSNLCEVVIIKRGKEGSLIKQRNSEIIKIKPCKIDLVNTNGAGDTYAAGFLTSYLLQNNDLKKCGFYGSIAASWVCKKQGARL